MELRSDAGEAPRPDAPADVSTFRPISASCYTNSTPSGPWGYQEALPEYRCLLGESHGVISTARHDFQGLAVLEAVAAGCQPLVPDSLTYPEWFGRGGWRYSEDVESCAANLSAAMVRCAERAQGGGALRVLDVRSLSWLQLAGEYEERL